MKGSPARGSSKCQGKEIGNKVMPLGNYEARMSCVSWVKLPGDTRLVSVLKHGPGLEIHYFKRLEVGHIL